MYVDGLCFQNFDAWVVLQVVDSVSASYSSAAFGVAAFSWVRPGFATFSVLVPCCFRWMTASVLWTDMVRSLPVLYLLLDQPLVLYPVVFAMFHGFFSRDISFCFC
jgi:hypothetical protein